MKSLNKNPLLVVLIVVAIVLAMRLSSLVLPRTTRVDPHINISDDRTRAITESQLQQQIAAVVSVTEGEVFRTEERIREATALATATSLFAAKEVLDNRAPANISVLLLGISNAGLLPPGLQLFDANGKVNSVRSTLIVCYRPDPLGVEVLSLGKVRLDGPALLIRLPTSGANNQGASLYVATSLEQTSLPSAFAAESEIFALGFLSEPLRVIKLPKP